MWSTALQREPPWISLCLAVSLDGQLHDGQGKTPAFTSRADRHKLFRLRSESDVILVGSNTVREEQLPPRIRSLELQQMRTRSGLPPHPTVVVVTASGNLPIEGDYFQQSLQKVMVMTTDLTASSCGAKWAAHGIKTISAGTPLSLAKGLKRIGRMGFRRVLAEGGGILAQNLFQQDLVDEFHLTVSPVILGGQDRPRLGSGPPLTAPRWLHLVSVKNLDSELHLVYTRPHSEARADAPKHV